MAFTHIGVTATYLQPDGSPAQTGTVSFMATGTMRDTDTNESVAPEEIVATVDEYGSIYVVLTATDGFFTTPRGVTYEVTERINGENENKFFIDIPENTPDGVLNLADIAPNIPFVSTYTYATKQYVDSLLKPSSENLPFEPTDEIFSTTVQGAIEEVRAKSRFVHTQYSASTVWHITHNLYFYPNVSVVDSGENVVYGDVQYIDKNNLTVTFTHSFAGKAYIS